VAAPLGSVPGVNARIWSSGTSMIGSMSLRLFTVREQPPIMHNRASMSASGIAPRTRPTGTRGIDVADCDGDEESKENFKSYTLSRSERDHQEAIIMTSGKPIDDRTRKHIMQRRESVTADGSRLSHGMIAKLFEFTRQTVMEVCAREMACRTC
jgi:hypothetical protein